LFWERRKRDTDLEEEEEEEEEEEQGLGQRRVSNAIAIASLRVHRSQASEAMASSCIMGAQTEILILIQSIRKFIQVLQSYILNLSTTQH
jgi:hypothetical protein